MKRLLPMLLLITAISCRREGALTREQQQYETVQEGSAAGVTSTVLAPGEVPSPAPMTGTNADTTTAFTLPTTSLPPLDSSQPGTLAGTLPPPPAYVPPPPPRVTTTPPTTATRAPEPEPVPAPTETVEPEPSESEEPAQTETAEEPREEPPPPPPGK